MSRLVAVAVLVLVLVGCGDGGGPAPAGSGGGPTTVAGGGTLPGLSNVLFGTAYDPASLGVTDVAKSLKAGGPMVAVGRILAARPASEVSVQITTGSTRKDPLPVSASTNPDSSDLFAVDLAPAKLTPGTWVIAFVAPNGRILASGNLQVTP